MIGGTRGLGLELARAAHVLGARVTVGGRDREVADEAARSVGEECRANVCDLTDWSSIETFISACGPIDHLILTAVDRDVRPLTDYRPEESARAILMKTVGYATAIHHALPRFRPNASVVMFGGLSAWRPAPGSTTLSTANSAIIGLMNSLALEVAPVRVNTIVPGAVGDSAATLNAPPENRGAFEALRTRTPTRRLVTTKNVVAATFALLDNDGINALPLVVDGGIIRT
ncbi:SDR family NAD(P)-dependent oxidoreductase [Cryptosporangium sp. NPDC051539]|uniref:SDR family NAD(P)-dependent oxidoreductase n=1 Tax=Cryptosporangium sp. NPDC051539 TaxID=3363962 RepID=UPI0037AD8585